MQYKRAVVVVSELNVATKIYIDQYMYNIMVVSLAQQFFYRIAATVITNNAKHECPVGVMEKFTVQRL